MEAYLRFVLKVAPAKGAVDFLCATTAAANMSAGQGLTLVPISAQLQLSCPLCNPT
jgi:hypothetical protein